MKDVDWYQNTMNTFSIGGTLDHHLHQNRTYQGIEEFFLLSNFNLCEYYLMMTFNAYNIDLRWINLDSVGSYSENLIDTLSSICYMYFEKKVFSTQESVLWIWSTQLIQNKMAYCGSNQLKLFNNRRHVMDLISSLNYYCQPCKETALYWASLVYYSYLLLI